MRKLLRQKRPWQVWVMLGDLAIYGIVSAISIVVYFCSDAGDMGYLSEGWKALLFVLTALPFLNLWLLLRGRKAGKYLYVVHTFLGGKWIVLAIFRLYCAFCTPSSLYIATGEVAADEARRAQDVSTRTPTCVWVALGLWVLCEPHVMQAVRTALLDITMIWSEGYVGYLAVACITNALRYLVWMLLLWAALLPHRSMKAFFTARLVPAAFVMAAPQAVLSVAWFFITPTLQNAPENVMLRVSVCNTVLNSAVLPLAMILGWSICVRRVGLLRGYLKQPSAILAIVFSMALQVSVVLLTTEHPSTLPKVVMEGGKQVIKMVDMGITIPHAPYVVETYFPVFAALLLWYSFRRYENKAAAPRGDA